MRASLTKRVCLAVCFGAVTSCNLLLPFESSPLVSSDGMDGSASDAWAPDQQAVDQQAASEGPPVADGPKALDGLDPNEAGIDGPAADGAPAPDAGSAPDASASDTTPPADAPAAPEGPVPADLAGWPDAPVVPDAGEDLDTTPIPDAGLVLDTTQPPDAPMDTTQPLDTPIVLDTTQPPDAPIVLDAPTGPDQIHVPPPCASGIQRLTDPFGVPDRIALCQDTQNDDYTQCSAGDLCNQAGGWQLCPASQYRTLAGTALAAPFPVDAAWIGGCIRDGGEPLAPTDGPCQNCLNYNGLYRQLKWGCFSVSGSFIKKMRVGLVTSDTCNAVGVDQLSTQSMWEPYNAFHLLDTAVCCRPGP